MLIKTPRVGKTPVVTMPMATCIRCGSTEKRVYRTDVDRYGGVDPVTKNIYTHIIRRWCRCERCHQSRIERSFECRSLVGESEHRVAVRVDESRPTYPTVPDGGQREAAKYLNADRQTGEP